MDEQLLAVPVTLYGFLLDKWRLKGSDFNIVVSKYIS